MPKSKAKPKTTVKGGASKKKSSKKPPADGACLLIVESPAKERTISRFLKKGYVVKSSYGHVRDLPVRRIGVSVEDGYTPQYVVLPRAKKIISDFKPLAERSPYVYLATDHDREGESIAWHLVELLNLSPEKVRRITFHEITPEAIKAALESPRAIDKNLVQAQQARRVIDRLVGYKLSPLLWAKIQSGLSAGRVQSAAVRLLAERDREIKEFSSESYWTMSALLEAPGKQPRFEAELTEWNGDRLEQTKTYDLFSEPYRVKTTSLRSSEQIAELEAAARKGELKISKLERKDVRRRPPPPFMTSTLQQAASQKLSFAAERTMRVAQSLYEGVDLGHKEPVGLISYMRTDSVAIAKSASEEAAAFLRETYGAVSVPETPPVYQTKSKRAQEAHEAIRPTSIRRTPDEIRSRLNHDQVKLYDLIWKRFAASQMAEAIYDTLSVDIDILSGGSEKPQGVFHATGRSVKFEGFLRVYRAVTEAAAEEDEEAEADDGSEDRGLPALTMGQKIGLVELKSEEHRTSPPPNYNEASLIRALERHGIGRPSTYAPTIKTIVDRGYVRRSMKDRKLLASDLGLLVTAQLKKHFPDVVSLTYTAEVEDRLDKIAEGSDAWAKVVDEFFQPFAKALEGAAANMEDSRVEPKESDEKCPICSTAMLIRESRFGKYLSCSNFPKCKGKMQLDAEGNKIVPEKTGELCDLCGKDMVIRSGRKGRFMACSGYPQCKNTFSLDAEGKKIEGSSPLETTRKCNKSEHIMWLRKGKRGFFLACSGFPKCRNIKPVSKEEGERLHQEGLGIRAGRKAAREREAAAKDGPPAGGQSSTPSGKESESKGEQDSG